MSVPILPPGLVIAGGGQVSVAPSTSGDPAPPSVTRIEPAPSSDTDTCASEESLSSRRSRRSRRSLGCPPTAWASRMAPLRPASSRPICWSSPPVPVIAASSSALWPDTVFSPPSRALMEVTSVCASSMRACRAAPLSGVLARSDHEFQKLFRRLAMPLSPGSASRSSTWSSASARVEPAPTCIAWARYCRSRKPSRMRL
jgi:hypothetical protein